MRGLRPASAGRRRAYDGRPAATSSPGSSPMSATAWPIPSWPGIATRSPPPTWITSASPAKDRAAPPAARAAAAAAIDETWRPRSASRANRGDRGTAAGPGHLRGRPARRPGGPLLFSKYSGGGMDITGESVLVRKKFTENFARRSQLFRRQGQRRLDRRAEPGEPDQGRAQAEERHRRVRARQDHLYGLVHRQRRARLQLHTRRASR